MHCLQQHLNTSQNLFHLWQVNGSLPWARSQHTCRQLGSTASWPAGSFRISWAMACSSATSYPPKSFLSPSCALVVDSCRELMAARVRCTSCASVIHACVMAGWSAFMKTLEIAPGTGTAVTRLHAARSVAKHAHTQQSSALT